MLEAARLITPYGKIIELSPEIYQQVQDLLARQAKPSAHAKIERTIRATYGKYAGDDSLTQALLTERATERAREDAKVVRGHA